MIGIGNSWLAFILALFKSRFRLAAENTALRHQVNILGRRAPRRLHLSHADRVFFVALYRLWPEILSAISIIQPDTIIRWHRRGFRGYWRRKSRGMPGRPRISQDIRQLIRTMSIANPLWGAPRIHGELLMLGIDVAQSSVSKYMARGRCPPGQSWRTFLCNHSDGIASLDLFVVPTLGFKLLFGLVVLRHKRRQLVHVAVTAHPTAEWLARQITEAFPWETAPTYLIRDRDGSYGAVFKRRVRSMGIRDRPTAPRSPWQNGCCERLIGSVRRECLDHMVVVNEAHLSRILREYARYYNGVRTHLALEKNMPHGRPVLDSGPITAAPWLGGLHHSYART